MRKTKYRGPVSLACDWSYSCPYQVNEREAEPTIYPPETNLFIHAYNDRAGARKERFLKDAGHFLWTAGQELERYGFLPAGVVSNPAGIAVSGDVWADYRHPAHDRWIYVNISECSVNMIGEAPPIGTLPATRSFTTRRDRVTIMGRWRDAPPEGRRGEARSWRSVKDGPNNWYDANLNSRQLANELLTLLLIEPEPATEFIQTSLFDQLAAA
jgi:hypothetical protein